MLVRLRAVSHHSLVPPNYCWLMTVAVFPSRYFYATFRISHSKKKKCWRETPNVNKNLQTANKNRLHSIEADHFLFDKKTTMETHLLNEFLDTHQKNVVTLHQQIKWLETWLRKEQREKRARAFSLEVTILFSRTHGMETVWNGFIRKCFMRLVFQF